MTTSMSCSTSRIVRPRSARSASMCSSSTLPEGGVDAGERLVEQQDPRLEHQRPCELEQLALAARERAGVVAAPCPRGRTPRASRVPGRARSAPRERHTGRSAESSEPLARVVRRREQHVVQYGHDGERLGELERAHHPLARDRVRARAVHRAPVEPHLAAVAALEARDDVEERRLAGAVRADQRGDRAARHGEGRRVDGQRRRRSAWSLPRRRAASQRARRVSSCRLPNSPCGRKTTSSIRTSPTIMNRSAAMRASESGSSMYRVASSTKMRKNDPTTTPR